MISIIVPVLNEAAVIETALRELGPLRGRGHEVIVVDGGSVDETARLAQPLADRILASARGRAVQMNAGAHIARGEVLLFLHVDTRLPTNADRLIQDALQARAAWGRFDVQIDGRHPLLRVVGCMMNVRSRVTGICTGDQALFVAKATFQQAGGYAAIDLMEDVELSRRLRRSSRPACLPAHVRTSARRWERHGVLRTIGLMMWLRLRYFFGASPAHLARIYDRERG